MPDPSTLYTDCFILFKYFGGRNIARLEREMRALGHKNFNRRILYSRTVNGVRRPGWIAKYGWDKVFAADEENAREPRHSSSPNWDDLSDASRPAVSPARSAGDFHAWLQAVSPGMKWHWRHQERIIKQLDRVTSGISKRLMIFLPPRHGKSELVTVRYSAWRMQQEPSMNVIVGSYNQRLADRFSRKIRHVITDAENIRLNEMGGENAGSGTAKNSFESGPAAALHPRKSNGRKAAVDADAGSTNSVGIEACRFPFVSSRPANSVSEWETAAGGGFRSVGVGGGVTGFGADLIVIDDPIKSRAEAESRTYRERVWQWFNDDLYTRLEPDGAMILIQTRWHEDDLAGRLLKDMKNGGEQWVVVSLPALSVPPAAADGPAPPSNAAIRTSADDLQTSAATGDIDWRSPGEALCPDRFDVAALRRIEKKLGSYSFAALYQQSPAPLDGGIFKRSWFTMIIDNAPEGLKWKRGYDLAVSTKTTACYTASFRCAMNSDGVLFIDAGFRERLEYPEQRRYVIERIRSETNTEHGIELALHGSALLQDLRRERAIRGHLLRGVKVETDKLTRSLAWAPLAEEGKVVLIRGAWNRDFLDEVCSFPNGTHDDQVDAVSLAVQMLRQRSYKATAF